MADGPAHLKGIGAIPLVDADRYHLLALEVLGTVAVISCPEFHSAHIAESYEAALAAASEHHGLKFFFAA